MNQFWLKQLWHAHLVHGYLNDILAGAALAAFSALLLALRFRLSAAAWTGSVLAIVTAAGCWWEWGTPLYRPASVSDPLDLAAYVAGACLYLALNQVFCRA